MRFLELFLQFTICHNLLQTNEFQLRANRELYRIQINVWEFDPMNRLFQGG